jgi:hypothetical protein
LGFPEIGRSPLDHEGILSAIVVEKGPDHLKPEFLIKGECPLVGLSHLSPKFLSRKHPFGLLNEGSCNAFSAVLGMDGKRNEMSILCKDEITEDLAFLFFSGRPYVYEEAFRMKPVKVKKGRSGVRRFRKGPLLDLNDAVKIAEHERPNHSSKILLWFL